MKNDSRKGRNMFSAILFITLRAVSPSQAPVTAREVIPQAQPVVAWLTAVQNGNQGQLKAVFSESMRRQFDKQGWEQVMRTYQETFKNEFGDYRLEYFSFRFRGDENLGVVLIEYKGKSIAGVQVVRENDDWKVNER